MVPVDVDQSQASNSYSFILIPKSHQTDTCTQISCSTAVKRWFSGVILSKKYWFVYHYLMFFETRYKMIYI